MGKRGAVLKNFARGKGVGTQNPGFKQIDIGETETEDIEYSKTQSKRGGAMVIYGESLGGSNITISRKKKKEKGLI